MQEYDEVTFEVRKHPTQENLRLNLAGLPGTPYFGAQLSIEVTAAHLSRAVKKGVVKTSTLAKPGVDQEVELTISQNRATVKVPRS